MTDHRRRAEELGRYFDWEKDTEQVREIAAALKEVEEETWKRAVEVVERIDDKKCPSSLCCSCAKNALREEAAKK